MKRNYALNLEARVATFKDSEVVRLWLTCWSFNTRDQNACKAKLKSQSVPAILSQAEKLTRKWLWRQNCSHTWNFQLIIPKLKIYQPKKPWLMRKTQKKGTQSPIIPSPLETRRTGNRIWEDIFWLRASLQSPRRKSGVDELKKKISAMDVQLGWSASHPFLNKDEQFRTEVHNTGSWYLLIEKS